MTQTQSLTRDQLAQLVTDAFRAFGEYKEVATRSENEALALAVVTALAPLFCEVCGKPLPLGTSPAVPDEEPPVYLCEQHR